MQHYVPAHSGDGRRRRHPVVAIGNVDGVDVVKGLLDSLDLLSITDDPDRMSDAIVKREIIFRILSNDFLDDAMNCLPGGVGTEDEACVGVDCVDISDSILLFDDRCQFVLFDLTGLDLRNAHARHNSILDMVFLLQSIDIEAGLRFLEKDSVLNPSLESRLAVA